MARNEGGREGAHGVINLGWLTRLEYHSEVCGYKTGWLSNGDDNESSQFLECL